MPIKISCLIAVFFFTSAVVSQDFMLQGKLTHPTEKELENIHVFNSTTSKGTQTDYLGDFSLAVSIGDTLQISSIQFKEVQLIISLKEFLTKAIEIKLEVFTNELDEVFLKNHNLSGYLKEDIDKIEIQPIVSALSLGIIDREIRVLTPTQRRLKTAQSGFLDPLINGISGRTKMLKKHAEADKKTQNIEKILAIFPKEYLINTLHIDKSKVYHFLYYCETDPQFVEVTKKDALTLLEFLKQQATNYLKIQKGN